MYLFVMVLNHTDKMAEIIEEFKRIGVKGATILDSIGSGRVRKFPGGEIPIIAGLKKLLENGYPHNKTIFSVVESLEQAREMVDVVESIVGDFTQPGTGIVFCLKLEFFHGGALGSSLKNQGD
ncbi:MAG: nitrogen regulatory protein 1 [Thermosediminibacterales bacterium]|nr:nitrogen regulatory protein 1 [Thermosediminibacterales bacterium]MDK2836033.1 nitrogen regulatory protein 1 [Thermosediminibacterales bacterium]